MNLKLGKDFYNFWFSLILGLAFSFFGPFETSEQNTIVAVGACVIWWWISECIPMAPAALFPLAVLPAATGMSMQEVAGHYANPVIFLFMGGFILAIAIEKHGIHRMMAVVLIKKLGTGAGGLLLALMLATFVLSMWVSNTATALVMLPIAVSAISRFAEICQLEEGVVKRLGIAAVLGIAYAANVGGMATLIGTPPNALFAGMMNVKYGITVDFLTWFLIGFPVAVSLLVAGYFLLKINLRHISEKVNAGILSAEKISLNSQQKKVFIIFAGACSLWIGSRYINEYFHIHFFSDTMIALSAAILMFLPYDKEGVLLEAEDIKKIPWSILLLFGGSLCIAGAMEHTGIVGMIGERLAFFSEWGSLGMMFFITGLMLFMTEFIGSTAITTMLLPVVLTLAGTSTAEGLYLAMPVVLAASGSFMLPTGTPPNAIVFASGFISVKDMVRIGSIMNILAWLLIAAICHLLVPLLPFAGAN